MEGPGQLTLQSPGLKAVTLGLGLLSESSYGTALLTLLVKMDAKFRFTVTPQ